MFKFFQTNHNELYRSKLAELQEKQKCGKGKCQLTLNFAARPNQEDKDPKTVKYSHSSVKHKELTTGLLDMISEAMLPLSFPDSVGFKEFMQLADPRYDVPSRRTLTRLLTNSLQILKTSVADHIRECTKSYPMYHEVHATVDLWSSRVMEPILGIR